MPLTRYQIRNEYGLADPELYRAADKDDPEALLEGVAMAGLVGVLRQLGDLAEFAAEIFHELHEEVMVTAARGHGLMVRVQQLESEFPSIEKAFLSQTTHSSFFSNAGIDWHPNLKSEQNLISRGDLPRFVMDSYEESRAPPRLFLLDKFDVAGAGSCLKRYTDPSFYKMEASSYEMTSAEVHKDKKIRKTKKKGSRWRNGGTPEILPPSHVKLHQLFLEERVENGVSEPARLVKLKRRPNKFPFNSKSGISYMEKLLETPIEDKVVHEIPLASSPLRLPTDISNASGVEALEISTAGSGLGSMQQNSSPCASPGLEENGCGQPMDDFGEDFAGETSDSLEAGNIRHEVIDEKDIAVDDDIRSYGSRNGYRSDDIVSETDNFVDALATMESETETETESRVKTGPDQLNADKQKTFSEANGEQVQSQFSDSQSIGNSTASDDGNSSIRKDIASCSYSDTGSSSADNMLRDGGDSPQVIPSGGSRGTEIAWRSSDKVAVTEKIPVICHPEQGVLSDSCIDVSKMATDNSGIGEVSSSSCPTDSALPVGQGAVLTEATAAEPDLGETSSCHREDFNSIKPEERQINFMNGLPSTSMTLDVPSPEKDYNSPSLLDERNSDDEADSEGPDVCSSPAIHFSKIAEATAENEDAENTCGKVITKEHAEDGFERDLVDSKLSSPHSIVSHAEDQLLVPSLPESNICVPVIKPDGFVSPDDTTYPIVEIMVNSSVVEDNPDAHSTEEQLAEIGDGVLAQSSDAEDIGVSCSTEKDLDGTFDGEDGVKMSGESTPMGDLVASDLPLEISKSPYPDQKSKLDGRETETVQTQAKVMLAAASVPIDGDGDCNIDGNRDEGRYSIEGPGHSGLVISKSYVVKNDVEPGTQKEQDQEAVTSIELNSVPFTAVSYYPSNIELLSTAPGSFLASEDGNENESEVTYANNSNLQDQALSDLEEADQNGEIIGDRALSELEEADQIGETIGEVHVVLNHKASNTKEEIDEQVLPSPNLDSIPCTAVSNNHSNAELLGSYPNSSLSTESKMSLHPGVAVTVSSSSNCPEQDIEPSPINQVNHIEEPEDISSSSSHIFPDLRTSLVETAEPQTNQLDEQLLHAPRTSKLVLFDSLIHMGPIQHSEHVNGPQVGKIDVESNNVIGPISECSQSQETQSSRLDHERESHDNASSVSCSATTSAQTSLLEPPESSIDKLNLSDHAKYPSTSVFSGFSLLPELPDLNLQEMPPLPPLPPMQWRMGKLQHSSQTTGFPPIFPPLVDQKSQMGHSAIVVGNMQPASPFLAPPRITDNNSRAHEDLTGNVMPSGPPLQQLPTHDTNQDVGPAEEGKLQPSANPLSPVSNMAAAASTHSSETSHQKVFLPPDELSTGASLGTQEQNHHLSTISQEKVVKYVEEVMPQPTNHQDVLLPPDELSNGASLGTQEHNRHPSTISQEKVKYVEVMPQPTNHQKVLLPLDELSTGASLGIQEQNHHPSTISQEKVVKYVEEVMPQLTNKNEQSQPSSDGEMFWSTSASSIPSNDDIRPTEIRPPKLLRPRSPLIDAVAAHDKSKLKKVTERVRPQPQKVEERDSLLEQIRAKSFNLKPAVPVRPSIHQVPKTNLKVAAILEKANAIRQAFAGIHEDDDSDSWSDS